VDQGRRPKNMLEFIAAHTSDVFVRVDVTGIVTYALAVDPHLWLRALDHRRHHGGCS